MNFRGQLLPFPRQLQIHGVADRDGAAVLVDRGCDLAEELIADRLFDRDVVGICAQKLQIFGRSEDALAVE